LSTEYFSLCENSGSIEHDGQFFNFHYNSLRPDKSLGLSALKLSISTSGFIKVIKGLDFVNDRLLTYQA